MAIKVKELCFEKFAPIIKDLGFELVDVFYGKQVDGLNLTFYIDCEDGIKINDCEKVHKVIDPILDELNPTNDEHYILNVSSIGLDWPIKTERDFKKNLGKEVEISLYVSQNGKKHFEGILKNFTKETVEIDCGETVLFDLKKIAKITPVIRF